MKQRALLTFVILMCVSLILNACQSAPKPAIETPATQLTPSAAYPPPAQFQSSVPYPGPSGAGSNFVSWFDLESAVMDGKAVQAYADQFGHVTLVLTDKTILQALGPSVDAISKLLTQCGTKCKDVKLIQQ